MARTVDASLGCSPPVRSGRGHLRASARRSAGSDDSLLEQTALVVVASVAGLLAYVAVVLALRVEEARQISALIRGQVARLR